MRWSSRTMLSPGDAKVWNDRNGVHRVDRETLRRWAGGVGTTRVVKGANVGLGSLSDGDVESVVVSLG